MIFAHSSCSRELAWVWSERILADVKIERFERYQTERQKATTCRKAIGDSGPILQNFIILALNVMNEKKY